MKAKDFLWIRISLWILTLFSFIFFIVLKTSDASPIAIILLGVLTIICVIMISFISKKDFSNKIWNFIGIAGMLTYGFQIFEGVRTKYASMSLTEDIILFLTFLVILIIGRTGTKE